MNLTQTQRLQSWNETRGFNSIDFRGHLGCVIEMLLDVIPGLFQHFTTINVNHV